MLSIFKKITPLIDDKIKKQLLVIYVMAVIGTFLETIGIGIVLPIFMVN